MIKILTIIKMLGIKVLNIVKKKKINELRRLSLNTLNIILKFSNSCFIFKTKVIWIRKQMFALLQMDNFLEEQLEKEAYLCSFYFFLYKQKKELVSCKFSTSSFWWTYTFWYALNTIWLYLENICMYMCVTNILWQE